MVSKRYLSPFGLRLSRNSQNLAYRLPTSNNCSPPVLHSIATSFGFFSFSATYRISEVGLFFFFQNALTECFVSEQTASCLRCAAPCTGCATAGGVGGTGS